MTTRSPNSFELDVLETIDLGSPIGQLRAVPVNLGAGAPEAVLLIYGADFDIDPYIEMFFFPTDTLKMVLVTEGGEILWRRDLGKGVVPGIWFCPVLAFDLDSDGTDEIWYVNNLNTKHPLGLSGYRLEQIDAHTGQTTGQWPWPNTDRSQALSHVFRNFIVGGHVHNEPVLVTAQGTYNDMQLQGWNADMSTRWEHLVKASDPGARGSHMCPIVDLNKDGIDELLWGERCIELDTGRMLFCADEDSYRGHSDIIQPVLDRQTNTWFIYTCRESGNVSPRVALFDAQGKRVWGTVNEGHMDMGWVARLGDNGELVASAIRIGHKVCGPDGRYHTKMAEFTFQALTGQALDLGYSTYGTIPVDIDGDGIHELVRGHASRNGKVLDRFGQVIGQLKAPVALACKLLNRPGEQLLAYYPEGTVRIWGDLRAEDLPAALERYAHPCYQANTKIMAVGYNLMALGGI